MVVNNEFADVLISTREPFDKNTFWICPKDGVIEGKVFDKGWKVITTTEDKGLSEKSEQEVTELVKKSENSLSSKINKVQGQYKNSVISLIKKNKELEQKIFELENKLDRLTKRYSTLLVK